MINAVIFGTGKTAEKLIKMLKTELVHILVFVDNNKNVTSFHNYDVITPDKLNLYNYDYIFIASVYGSEIEKQLKKIGINENKIIKMVSDKKGGDAALLEFHYLVHNPFQERLEQFISFGKETELLITGISYHNDGIDTEYFDRKAFNLAIRGQDIFYDYTVIKHLFENYNEMLQKVKYVIIGLSYYSFEYDFSKSSSAVEALRYYPEIQEAHNFISNDCIGIVHSKLKQKLMKYKDIYKLLILKDEYELSETEGEKAAKVDSEKNFPYTVYENQNYLRKYIDFLLERKIKPIILIMPVTKYYSSYFNKDKINKFYSELNTVIGHDTIQVLDYFDKLDISDEYWYHVNHLNKQGAVLFTKMLQDDISW